VIFHGTQDLAINWEGVNHGSPDSSHRFFGTRSVLESVGYWSAHNQCVTDSGVKTEYEPQVDTKTQIIRFDFESCANNAGVRFFAMVNAGHVWPGGTRLGDNFGQTPMDINAGQEIWDFLSQFRRDDL
jgi:polyhydroxybutyrate depolymerase